HLIRTSGVGSFPATVRPRSNLPVDPSVRDVPTAEPQCAATPVSTRTTPRIAMITTMAPRMRSLPPQRFTNACRLPVWVLFHYPTTYAPDGPWPTPGTSLLGCPPE